LATGDGGHQCSWQSSIDQSHWLETGFLSLLPTTEQNPEIARVTKQHNELMARKVIWLSGAATSQAAIVQAQHLKQKLQKSGLFNRIVLKFSTQNYRENNQHLFPFRYQLLDSQTKLTLAVNPRDLIAQNLDILYSLIGQMQSPNLERDSLLLFSRYFNAHNPIKLNVEQGIVILHNGHMGIVLLMLLTFRSPKPLLLSFLAIGCGMFSALVPCVLFFGKIHIITLVFGASLIDVAGVL
jgi:predicted exporter